MSKLPVVIVAAAMLTASQAGPPPASRVAPLFDLSPDRSPFPSDRFTVPDARQLTGLRVNLPMPDCTARKSDCEDVAVLNQFDGFNREPRISVPFSGAIDPASVDGRSVFLARVGGATGSAPRIGINYVVWDPATRELSFRPAEILEEHTTYALVVTTAVRAADGAPIGVASGYRADAQVRAVTRGADVAVASVFTTQSTSFLIQRIRDAVRAAPAPHLDFRVGPDGERAVFAAADVDTLVNNADTSPSGPLSPTPLTQGFQNMRAATGAVGTLAFGRFRGVDFTVHPSGHLPMIASRTGTLAPTGSYDVSFNLWLPAGTTPPGGWPVAICAHGSNGSKNFCFSTAAVVTSRRIAVIGINMMGHGGGPRTTMTAGLKGGRAVTVAAPGLGYDANGDGQIQTWEPFLSPPPYALLDNSGTLGQTVALQLQLVRALQAGADVDGDGSPDLDGSRIYYYGSSLGGTYGMSAFAIEPAIRAAVFVVPAGTMIYNRLLSPPYRARLAPVLAARVPSLLNETHGVATLDGWNVAPPLYNENLPLRDTPVLVNHVPGAIDIQRYADRNAWATQATDAVAAAALLRRAPLAGVQVRPFLVQAARSDPASTNPCLSAIVRAGDFADRVALYRHDLNFGNDGVPQGPHTFLGAVGLPPAYARVARGALEQIATFFESDGKTVITPAPAELWEMPIRKLPDDLFLMPRPRPAASPAGAGTTPRR
jgi:hypothetical protein